MHARMVELFDLVDKELSGRILERDLRCKGYVMHFIRDGERTEPVEDFLSGAAAGRLVLAHPWGVVVEVDPWDDAKWALGAAALVLRATLVTPLDEQSADHSVRARLTGLAAG